MQHTWRKWADDAVVDIVVFLQTCNMCIVPFWQHLCTQVGTATGLPGLLAAPV